MVAGDERSDLAGQLLHARDAARRLQVQERPQVQAAGRRVTGEAGAPAVGGHDALQVGDEVGQPLGRHRGVLDEGRGPLRARRPHEQRQDGAPQRRGVGQSLGLLQPHGLRGAQAAGERAEPREAGARLVVTALVLHREQRRVRALEQGGEAAVPLEVRRPAQRLQVEELDRRRRRLEDRDVGLERGAQGREGEGRADAARRALVQRHLKAGEEHERALRPGEEPAQVRLGREQLAQVVAGGAPARPREAAGDGLAVPLAHPRERRREPLPRRPACAGGEVAGL